MDKIELALMPENMPVYGVCHMTDSGTGRCTRNMRNKAKNTRNDTYTTINGF
jgi:hypothetical protein